MRVMSLIYIIDQIVYDLNYHFLNILNLNVFIVSFLITNNKLNLNKFSFS